MATKNRKDHRYTDEEKQFLAENISGYTYKELTDRFNIVFHTDLNESSISDLCIKRMHLHRGKEKTYFKDGKKAFNEKQIWSETTSCGYVFVKVSNQYIPNSERSGLDGNPNWVKKQYLVWEKEHGKVPNGNLIIFLDKDRTNCDIDNLYCVDRKVNLMMAKNGWYTADREHTLAALKWCELYYAMKKG